MDWRRENWVEMEVGRIDKKFRFYLLGKEDLEEGFKIGKRDRDLLSF